MNFIKVILINLIILLTGTLSQLSAIQKDNEIYRHCNGKIISSNYGDYTYVRVLISDIWWIYVYDSDGKLIDQYPEDATR